MTYPNSKSKHVRQSRAERAASAAKLPVTNRNRAERRMNGERATGQQGTPPSDPPRKVWRKQAVKTARRVRREMKRS